MRAPQSLGPYRHWRDKIRAARNDGDWYAEGTVGEIHAELIEWLRDHPIEYVSRVSIGE